MDFPPFMHSEFFIMKTLIIPTYLGTEIQIPDDYPIPPVGVDFWINFHRFTPPDDWEMVRRVLEDNSLSVSVVDGDRIYLQEGSVEHEVEDYREIFHRYWEKNPDTRPPVF
ncbi:hypothetical protein PBT90_20025 [Algoriphagus halophytocola]|uniref:hypothetical protein n=1 Tax=Algoriphagus halophytocola TaxID=2991499 RepID=UPI0022DE8AA1|nr:hypothetical protein [Algoriphagus sp. TR-M9]WBL43016.1 hypothetical protein PBT90_20025 [Algoriphagus sp. TR-M9]